MRPLALLLLGIAPVGAWAQTAVLDITVNDGRDAGVFGPGDCDIDFPITWTVTPLLSCTPLRIWMTTAENCLSDPGSGDLTIHTQPENTQLSTDTFRRRVDQLPVFVADGGVGDGGVACGDPGVDFTWKLCGNVKFSLNFGTCDSTASEATPPTIRFDSKAPGAPEITRAEGVDSAVLVNVDIDTDTAIVIVVATDPAGVEASRVERSTPTGTIRLGNLTNGTTYTVTAQARDFAGNVSESSLAKEATPVPTSGFFRRYIDAGGSEDGGCSSGGGAALGVVGAAMGAWFAWRRRRRWR